MVLVHLMQMYNPVWGVVEKLRAHGREGDGRVRKLPLFVRGGVDFGAEGTAEDLVAETDAAEADVRAVLPESCCHVKVSDQGKEALDGGTLKRRKYFESDASA